MDFLNNLFTGLPTLSLGLIGLITLMTLWFAGPGYNSQSASHSPTILTSTGIFGTFLGVALGLLAFDTKDIQASVPELIEGLKTAFWTSIAGLLGSLIVKFRHLTAVLRQRQVEEQYRSATVTDLANLLGDIRDSISNSEAKVYAPPWKPCRPSNSISSTICSRASRTTKPIWWRPTPAPLLPLSSR